MPTLQEKKITIAVLGIDLDCPEWKAPIRSEADGELRSKRRKLLEATRTVIEKAQADGRNLSKDEQVAVDEGWRIAEYLANELTQRKASADDDTDRSMTRAGQYVETASGERVRLLRADERMADGSPSVSYGVGELVRGLATSRWSNDEARDMAGASTTAGGVLLSPSVHGRLYDMARAKTALIQAGALTLPMETGEMKIARITGDVSVQWRAENVAVTASDFALSGQVLKARTAVVILKSSLELAEDAPNYAAQVEASLANAMAVEMDRVGLVGLGSAEEPMGLENVPGVGTATSVGSPTWDDLCDAVTTIRNANGEPTAAILAPRDAGTLGKLKGTANDHYITPPDMIRNLPRFTTTLVPKNRGGGGAESLGFVGDFSQFLFGIRTGARLEVSRTAADSTGSAFSNVQLWIRLYVRLDCVVVRPNHFVVLSGITA